MSATIEHIKGKFILNARFTAEEGYAEVIKNALKEIQNSALSDAEPGCLTYRVCRSGNDFMVFEE
ncbi:hypothetical protein RhiJN_08424 [Ceratobasidium sp. AG-Ba]|nr:hypothetical protein RhiJN_08424 [Ceratobasidium sp. AG-Ba]